MNKLLVGKALTKRNRYETGNIFLHYFSSLIYIFQHPILIVSLLLCLTRHHIQTQLTYEEEDYIIESGMEKKKDERGN